MTCLKRKPKRMARVMAELEGGARQRTLPAARESEPKDSDEKLSEYWLKLYRGYIDYLSGGNELSPNHLETLNSVERAADSFMERIGSNPELERATGGIVELDRVLRKLMAGEYAKIARELERREELLEQAIAGCKTTGEEPDREKLEELLGAADEAIRLKKLSHSSNLERLVEIRSAIRGGLDYARAESRRERASQKREYVKGKVEVEDNNVYKEMISRAAGQIGRIGSGRRKFGVLGEAEIRSLFEVRDSCYDAVSGLGLKAPVKEIEELIKGISERELRLVEGFIARNQNKKLKSDELRQALAYRGILKSWEGYA